ncbi:hypothetical protein R1sor_017787 [Riccia sorocarpa]|uniref:Uncharacterized protein n=1 Tax=Riccia sorocarpa TaxID=122646 RepID=A0ABD3I7T8_9MARC
MVEYQDDSIGPSPILKRDELRSWELCSGRTDMVDARLCATRSLGQHFTRHAWHGNRFDQSRLDRFYLTKGGEWVYHIRLKAKHAQEEITATEDTSGRVIEDREELLDEVHNFYENLYTFEIETEEMLECRRTVVGRLDRRLTVEQNVVLEELPSEELITKIVMEMPKEKSPGIDGIMVEILRLG